MSNLVKAKKRVVESMPVHLKQEHRKIVEILQDATRSGTEIHIHADRDPDGATGQVFGHALDEIGGKVHIRHEDRDEVSFEKPGLHILYDIGYSEAIAERAAKANARIIVIDHHAVPAAAIEIHRPLAIANAQFTDPELEDNHKYAYNPSAQLIHILQHLGREIDPASAVHIAVGIVGDKAHRYHEELDNFVAETARAHSTDVSTLEKIADSFELYEQFPREVFGEDGISIEELHRKLDLAAKKGELLRFLLDPKIRALRERANEILDKYKQAVESENYTHDFQIAIGGRSLRVVVLHVPDNERMLKVKSAAGSMMLDRHMDDAVPTIVLAGQKEGTVFNYRIGVNRAAQALGISAGEIARWISSNHPAGVSGGGHNVVAGLKIRLDARDRIKEIITGALRQIYNSA